MAKSIYLVNPRSDFPTYFSAEVYAVKGLNSATLMADLAIPTLAALAPRDLTYDSAMKISHPWILILTQTSSALRGKLSNTDAWQNR